MKKKKQLEKNPLYPDTMTIPPEVEIKQSEAESGKLGAWCRKPMKKGQKFGPFAGKISRNVSAEMDGNYVWEIVDQKSKQFLFYIDATDARRANWLRYVNCARFFEEQNLVSEQEGTDIFYTTIKDVDIGEELLTWYARPELNKNGEKSIDEENTYGQLNARVCKEQIQSKKKVNCGKGKLKHNHSQEETISTDLPVASDNISLSNMKTKTNTKVTAKNVSATINNDLNETKLASANTLGNYRRAKAAHKFISNHSINGYQEKRDEKGELKKFGLKRQRRLPLKGRSKLAKVVGTDCVSDKVLAETKILSKASGETKSLLSGVSNNINHDNFSSYFQFELLAENVMATSSNSKLYKCHICFGVYRHIFSLKRHFIRDHVNIKYVSEIDRHNCLNKEIVKQSSDGLSQNVTDGNENVNGHNDSVRGNLNSNLTVVVNVSPTGKVFDRKVEKKTKDTFASKLNSKTSLPDSKIEKSAKLNQKSIITTVQNNLTSKNASNIKGSRVEMLNLDDLYKCHCCTSTFSTSLSLSTHLKSHISLNGTSSNDKPMGKTTDELHIEKTQDNPSGDSSQPACSDMPSKICMENRFKCDVCNAIFTARFSLNRHKLKRSCKKMENGIGNHMRQRKTFTVINFNRPLKKLTVKKEMIKKARCRYCHEVFGGGRQLKVHRRTVHPEFYFECILCGRYFHDQVQLDLHTKTNHSTMKDKKKSLIISALDKNVEENPVKEKKNSIISTHIKEIKEVPKLPDIEMIKTLKPLPCAPVNPIILSPVETNPLCITCDRQFTTYAKYVSHCELLHRRQMTADGSRKTLLAKLSQFRAATTPRSLDLSAEMEINHNERFYANVARKIRDNLANFLSGKATELNANVDTGKKPRRGPSVQSLKAKEEWKQLVSNDAVQPELNYSLYNFPPNFLPRSPVQQLLYLSEHSKNVVWVTQTVNSYETEEVKHERNLSDTSVLSNESLTEVPIGTKITPNVEDIYTCCNCKRKFGTFVMYQEHMRLRHGRTVQRMTESSYKVSAAGEPKGENALNVVTTVATKISPEKERNSEENKSNNHIFNEPLSALQLALNSEPKNKIPKAIVSDGTCLDQLAIVVPQTDTSSKSEPSPQLTVRPHRLTHSPGYGMQQVNLISPSGRMEQNTKQNDQNVVSPAKSRFRFICKICNYGLAANDEFEIHESLHHPSIECSCIDLADENHFIPPKFHRTYVGLLQVSSSILPSVTDGQTFIRKCTKCNEGRDSLSEFHKHLMDCAGPEPVRYYYTYALPTYVRRQSSLGKFQKRKVLYRSMEISSTASESSFPGSEIKSKEKGYKKLARLPYNLRNQLQGKDVSLSDASKLKCEGCGILYGTISSLERHIPICVEKEKLRQIVNNEGQNSSEDEDEYDPNKHMCIYCTRQFTYQRLLLRHLTESCPVKKKLVSEGEYIDLEWESDLKGQYEKQKLAKELLQTKLTGSPSREKSSELESGRSVRKQHRGVWWGSRKRSITPSKLKSYFDENSSNSSISFKDQICTPNKLYDGDSPFHNGNLAEQSDKLKKIQKCELLEHINGKNFGDIKSNTADGAQNSKESNQAVLSFSSCLASSSLDSCKRKNLFDEIKTDAITMNKGKVSTKEVKKVGRTKSHSFPLSKGDQNKRIASSTNNSGNKRQHSISSPSNDKIHDHLQNELCGKKASSSYNINDCENFRNSKSKTFEGFTVKKNCSISNRVNETVCSNTDYSSSIAPKKKRAFKRKITSEDAVLKNTEGSSKKSKHLTAGSTCSAALVKKSMKVNMMHRQVSAALSARKTVESRSKI